jgi:hypothetical protein
VEAPPKMKTPIPRFVLRGPLGWRTFATGSNCTVLPGFSDYDIADAFCREDHPGCWELRSLAGDEMRRCVRAEFPQTINLVAINPVHPRELSLPAMSLNALSAALQCAEPTAEVEYRLMRDHWNKPWLYAKTTATDRRTPTPGAWYVACLYPQGMKFACGQPLWFWLDWFEGRHVLTELQRDHGVDMEREFFLFPTHAAAEGFYKATVARLLGCVADCQIGSHVGSEFEVAFWEKGHDVCNRTSATLGKQVW